VTGLPFFFIFHSFSPHELTPRDARALVLVLLRLLSACSCRKYWIGKGLTIGDNSKKIKDSTWVRS
jgi:hypothetical protein